MKTFVFDTNIILRYFLKDVENQYKVAAEVVDKIERGNAQGKLSLLVVAEIVWMLGNVYKIERKIFIPQILQLIAFKRIKIIETKKELLEGVLKGMINNKLDLVDVYLSKIASKKEIFSFDRDFKKLYK